MFDSTGDIPYCGPAPLPGELWLRWNLDPVLIGVLLALAVAHGLLLFRGATHPASRARTRVWLGAGWAAVFLALVSPLCALGVALFSARVGQHMWLMLIAAPLLMLAHAGAPRRTLLRPLSAAVLFAIALWGWHLPAAYALTFQSDLAYWAMHGSLFAAAVLLWQALISAGDDRWLTRLGAGFFTLVHMGLLGALITLAPRLLYFPHALTASSWGFTPLADQQLGGLIMWVPACAVLLIAGLGIVHELLVKRPRADSPSIAG